MTWLIQNKYEAVRTYPVGRLEPNRSINIYNMNMKGISTEHYNLPHPWDETNDVTAICVFSVPS